MENVTSGRLNAKLLEEKLKKGWGTANFAADLGMSEQEFMEVLDKTFYGPASQNYRRRLKKNDKSIEKQLKRRACSIKAPSYKEFPKEENEEYKMEKKESVIKESIEGLMTSELSDLEKALALEREFINSLISLENEHKKEVAERKNVFEKASKLKDRMLRLKKELKESAEEATMLFDEKAQIDINLERINNEKAEIKTSLDEVREEIAELRKVQVNIVDDIEIIPAGEYIISDEWKELRTTWLDDEKFSSLTIMEISLLAKAILLKRAIIEDNRRYEFAFVSDDLEKLFNELS